jgi:glycosyltransferase involved in cell wall biosynthesis
MEVEAEETGQREVRRPIETRSPIRLGLYLDVVYRAVDTPRGPRFSTDRAFILFAQEVASHFESWTVFGRVLPSTEEGEYALAEGTDVVALPYYSNLRRLGAVGRAFVGTARAFSRGLDRADVVWIFGPHVFGWLLAMIALTRRRRVVLGVRQDTVQYTRRRVTSRRWLPILAAVQLLDLVDRLASRHLPTIVVGDAVGRRYGAPRPRLHVMTVSLVREADVLAAPRTKDWSARLGLLAVGRLEPEKNPLLLVELLAELERRDPGRYHLTWIGRGVLEDAVRRRASELGVDEWLELIGYVPFGPELLERYRRAHIFVHISLTEGLPQVIVEAHASGTPVVATDVGSVRAALDGGAAGILVPPDDLDALAAGVELLVRDPVARERMVRRGLELARERTFERQTARVARFIAQA